MTNYSRGADFEREVKADLQAMGWAATRSAGSHGEMDVMAYHFGIGLFVQCKRNGDFPPEERRALVRLAKKHNAIPVAADKKNRGIIMYHRLADDSVREAFWPGPTKVRPKA